MKALMKIAMDAGATGVGMAKVADIVFDPAFRDACAQNICGKYGTCWMCPPDVGDIDRLIAQAKSYEHMMVFQSIGYLEDSFDFEGMGEAAVQHNRLTLAVAAAIPSVVKDPLILGAGACHICTRCTRADNKPCAHPKKAIPSLEAYGIAVSELAEKSGLKYINGENTVTYFGGVLFRR